MTINGVDSPSGVAPLDPSRLSTERVETVINELNAALSASAARGERPARASLFRRDISTMEAFAQTSLKAAADAFGAAGYDVDVNFAGRTEIVGPSRHRNGRRRSRRSAVLVIPGATVSVTERLNVPE
jgi:hypothetical protein